MSVRYQQTYNPDLGVVAVRGWCQKYIDDGGNAPTRRPSAQAAGDAEAAAGRLRGDELPSGVWVVIYFALNSGPYKGLGHVAFARRNADGSMEIRDSEVRAGARAAYRSIDEVLRWFANHSPSYRGWSTSSDGRQYVTIIEEDDENMSTDYQTTLIYAQALLFRDMSREEYDKFHAGKSRNQIFDEFNNSDERKNKLAEMARAVQSNKTPEATQKELAAALEQAQIAQAKIAKVQEIVK